MNEEVSIAKDAGEVRTRAGLPFAARMRARVGALTQAALRPYLYHVIVHVTDRCNLRCKTCFVSFGHKDLTVDEARVIGAKLGYVPALDIGGGEPFLHRDLLGICRQLRFGTVTIPTNGQFLERVLGQTRALVDAYPGRVTVALSLDGFEAVNDAIRGPGTFAKAIGAYHELRKIPSLIMKVNTVVNNRNLDEMVAFARYVRTLEPDYHSLLLLRGDPLAPEEVELPSAAALRAITPELFKVLRTYKYGHRYNPLLRWLKGNYQEYMWHVQLRIIELQRAPFQCKAPRYNKVVYANGETSMCELKPRLANLLHDAPEKVDRVLCSHLEDFEEQHGCCFCTHNCNMSENIITHPPSVARILFGRTRT